MRRLMSRAAWTLPMLALLAPTRSLQAEDRTLLIELDPESDALPNAVNPTGTVVGKFATSGGFYRMPTTGVIDLGGGFATGVSADGATIVGGVPPARTSGMPPSGCGPRSGGSWAPFRTPSRATFR